MQISDSFVLGGQYPLRTKTRRSGQPHESAVTKESKEEALLKMAIAALISAEVSSNALQLEYLKTALIQVNATSNSGRALVACAEQLLSTASNSSWIDRELMYDFFFKRVGLGAAAARECASSCLDNGIPSPQYLALAWQKSDVIKDLGLNEHQTILLRSALTMVRQEIGHALGEKDPVWVEVGTPETLDHEDDRQHASTSAAPPPTPASPRGSGGGCHPNCRPTAHVGEVSEGLGHQQETMERRLSCDSTSTGGSDGLERTHGSKGSGWFLALFDAEASPGPPVHFSIGEHTKNTLTTPSPDIYIAPSTPAPQLHGPEPDDRIGSPCSDNWPDEPPADGGDASLACSTFTASSAAEDSAPSGPDSTTAVAGTCHTAGQPLSDDDSWEVPLRAALLLPGEC